MTFGKTKLTFNEVAALDPGTKVWVHTSIGAQKMSFEGVDLSDSTRRTLTFTPSVLGGTFYIYESTFDDYEITLP